MIECPNCEESTPKLYEAPRLRIPAPRGYHVDELGQGELIRWHPPGSAFPGDESFELLEVLPDGWLLVLPPETPADGCYCARCWGGRLWPALFSYTANHPPDFRLDGYRDPIMLTQEGGATDGL